MTRSNKPRVHALLPAAGRSVRFGAPVPKQYADLLGRPVIAHSIDAVGQHDSVAGVTVVLAEDDKLFEQRVRPLFPEVSTAPGGDSRAHSVLNGLRHVIDRQPECDWVLVHDAARPCLSATLLNDLLSLGLNHSAGAILAVPVSDTLKQTDESGCIQGTIDRSTFWAAQTPQLFPIRKLAANLEAALARGLNPTDEAAAMEAAGEKPLLVNGASSNLKITTASDLALAEFIMQKQICTE